MGRKDRGGSRALDEDTAQALVRLLRELPTASVITLISGTMRQRLTFRPQALRGRAAQRHLAE
ncbi:hypothetical protein DFAR_2800019 [Desulfarculales bacterium]